MIDAWLEPDDEIEEYTNNEEHENDDNQAIEFDFDAHVDRALRAIERAFFEREGYVHG
jgi:hypothetical protein